LANCSIGWASAIKKSLAASEQLRSDIVAARDLWINRRSRFFNKALPRLVFLDETSTNTKLTKRTGWAPRGRRYRTHAPFGTWKTQTFIAALRCHSLTAPWIVDAPMNKQIFETYIETQLAPTLSKGDVVIMDNVAFHKSTRVEKIIKERGAWVLFLPPYSPDLNPPLSDAMHRLPVNDRIGLLKTQGFATKGRCTKLRYYFQCTGKNLQLVHRK
jgi:hypothetical protein